MNPPKAVNSRLLTEPFRLFFPLGILASLIGVLLWPAFFKGWLSYYPLEAHARWMVIGFGGSFITGFLGTAGPRLLGNKPWTAMELVTFLVSALTTMCCLALNRIAVADLLAGVWLLGILASLLFRVLYGRQDIPPPGFPLVALGIGGAGIAGIMLSQFSTIGYSVETYSFLRLIYFQGLLWLPILGVAPYLLPRFFGKKSLHAFDESATFPNGWVREFSISAFVGVLMVASFALEAWLNVRAGMILRVVVFTSYLFLCVPGIVPFGRANGLGLALRLVIPCVASGWILVAVFPHLRIGVMHLAFIGGAGLLMFVVGTRVIFGHNDRHDLLTSPMRWFHVVWGLVLLTAATRLSSDFVAKVRISHFTYAAVLWVFITAFWWWKMRCELKRPAIGKGATRSHCPRRRSKAVERGSGN